MEIRSRLAHLVGYYDDRFWRYSDVVRFLKTLKSPTVLEIGNDGEGITRMWQHQVIGLDIRPNGRYQNILQVLGTASALPFRDRAFDVVIAMDVLEHIPPDVRATSVHELLRVTHGCLIIGFPTGKTATKYEREVNDFYKRLFRKDNPWLIEHIRNGLPNLETVLGLVEGYDTVVTPNVNVHFWRLYMKLLSLFTSKPLGRPIWDAISLVAVRPLDKLISRGEAYRVIIRITRKGGTP